MDRSSNPVWEKAVDAHAEAEEKARRFTDPDYIAEKQKLKEEREEPLELGRALLAWAAQHDRVQFAVTRTPERGYGMHEVEMFADVPVQPPEGGAAAWLVMRSKVGSVNDDHDEATKQRALTLNDSQVTVELSFFLKGQHGVETEVPLGASLRHPIFRAEQAQGVSVPSDALNVTDGVERESVVEILRDAAQRHGILSPHDVY